MRIQSEKQSQPACVRLIFQPDICPHNPMQRSDTFFDKDCHVYGSCSLRTRAFNPVQNEMLHFR